MSELKRRTPTVSRPWKSHEGDQPASSNAHGQSQTVVIDGQTVGADKATKPERIVVPKPLGAGVIALVCTGVFALALTVLAGGYMLGVNSGQIAAQEAYEAYPLGSNVPYPLPTAEGGPCLGFEDGVCSDAQAVRFYMAQSRYYLNRGDSEVAIGALDKARVFYDWTIALGRPVGAPVARQAATRLQFLNLTCDYSEESLARIARDNEFNMLGGRISMSQRQRALRALAHYTADVDGQHSQATRDAVQRFQSTLWFPETGVLSSEQAVLLVCGAAEIGNDPASQNLLGTMYAVGLGVRQNTDKALQWLNEAARQGSADAFWNLALLFGTQTTESSVLVCDADLSPERADSFLREAYEAGHPAAVQAAEQYGELDPETRWARISSDLRTPEALTRVGKGCNPNG